MATVWGTVSVVERERQRETQRQRDMGGERERGGATE